MKRLIIFLSVLVFGLTGCSFDVQVVDLTPQAPPAAVTPVTLPVSGPTIVPATPLPAEVSPMFFAAHTTADITKTTFERSFPAGTQRVYVVWQYQNMQAGMTVKREWLLDGRVWLTREEPWDFAKYGAEGVMRDVSIFDLDAGLPSGVYQLQMYIDGIQQPIGADTMFGPEDWLNFEVRAADGAASALLSPDGRQQVTIYDLQRIVLRDASGAQFEVFTGNEINYLTWFLDNRHFLFTDRDYSNQQPGSPLGVRDRLYIADVATGQVTLLYDGDVRFKGYLGPQPALDGRYISGLAGSGFGDACFVDTRLVFFELAADFKSAQLIEQQDFPGMPAAGDGVVYPDYEGVWRPDGQYAVPLKRTCVEGSPLLGTYVFDLPNRKTTLDALGVASPLPGDLGWGEITGTVLDAVTGQPIVAALVVCEHNSYTSGPAQKCAGGVETDASGAFRFQHVFFHDTDTLRFTITAPGYQAQTVTKSSFTTPGLAINFTLQPAP